ncbi:MAG: isoleucine--tRNA ligase [Candidatus Dependentiae bacterium]
MAESLKPDNQVSFKNTLNLPQTDFPIRAQAAIDDPALIKRWQQEDLYEKTFVHNKDHQQFILHDGPPYANGHIHIGHAYNKILKDIIGKSKRMQGKQVPITPGWDCHGLPIELKVSQENPGLAPAELKKACRAYAQKWIDTQKEEFKRLGVLMDWDRPYLTMSYAYESDILRAFGFFVEGGYIERKNKTVPWCPACQTVLASAEIEYHERKDPSIYVLFPLENRVVETVLPTLTGKTVNFLVWTTTPWTLPLNRAVLIKPGARYVVLRLPDEKYIIVTKQLADKIATMLEVSKEIVAEFSSEQLIEFGAYAHHPFVEGLRVPVILSDTVLLEDGTACVHCAPGCGPEDYEVGVRNNLEIYSPITPAGTYDKGINPAELQGMSVTDGQIWVIKKLAEQGKLLYKTTIRHSYPHCWRSRDGLIFRATKQWFCDLERNGLKEKALKEIEQIVTLPEKSGNRLHAAIEGRLEWCLSRQRIWGVPIPALLCTTCDHTYITKEFVDKVADKVKEQGIEYWDTVELSELVTNDFACPVCKGTNFVKEKDILDVWFDSGISHYAVLNKKYGLSFPADVYAEGKDQHRGWFQSSLLTGLVIEGTAPMRTIVTHGFTVDEQGRKMSKSLGNVVSPQQMIDQLGTDGLRLWVSSIDCSGDAVISAKLIENVKEVFRKIRNTCRFLLSNLYDFDIAKDAISFDKMEAFDRYAVHIVQEINDKTINQYNDFDFTAVFHTLGDYCATELSSFYLDIIKDRLYVEQADGHLRRSAQTSCWYILDTLTKMMAPILSFTAEQVSDLYQKNKKESIHLQSFAQLSEVIPADDQMQDHEWDLLKKVRSAVLKAIEGLRQAGIIKHSLEAQIALHLDYDMSHLSLIKHFVDRLVKNNQSPEQFFKEFFIVSSVSLRNKPTDLQETDMVGVWVHVAKAEGTKCPRCWNWEVTDNEYGLCKRCQKVLTAR